MTLCTASLSMNASTDDFKYTDEKFADIQMLRYKVTDFEKLTLRQKILVYYLSEAALYGRDILFDQNGAYNLRIRKMLETVYCEYKGNRNTDDFQAMTTYLKRVWFSNGIHHHYGCEKFVPGFSQEFFRNALKSVSRKNLPLKSGQTVDKLCDEIFPIIFDPTIMPMRVNLKAGDDLIKTSAANYYGTDISQQEVEAFYADMRQKGDPERPVMYGLNSQLVKKDGQLQERVWSTTGMYGAALSKIVSQLQKALPYAESEAQANVIRRLIDYYISGNLKDFDQYCIEWVKNTDDLIDFTNGFTEVYGDPLGMKGTWEGIVEYKDLEATKRTQTISQNAQWFEDHSPVDPRFRKPEVKGVTANVICAAMLGGEEYPASAIGINLPNSNWIRQEHGSKSVTIGNLTDAYNKAAQGNGFRDEFVIDKETVALMNQYADITDDLHTDLHECLGHGSGQLLPTTDPDALKAYGNTIEEARADLFGLYYVADHKLVELGLTPNDEAYKAQYYSYLMNGLLTQTIRIKEGDKIEEAHMRNRALIAWWTLEHAEGAVELVQEEVSYASAEDALKDAEGNIITTRTYMKVNDYEKLRHLFGELLAEIQRIKSEGDYEAARQLVEKYAVNIDPALHREILARYKKLNLAPYKGFINPKMTLVFDEEGNPIDVNLDYEESYTDQMLRYSEEYGTL